MKKVKQWAPIFLLTSLLGACGDETDEDMKSLSSSASVTSNASVNTSSKLSSSSLSSSVISATSSISVVSSSKSSSSSVVAVNNSSIQISEVVVKNGLDHYLDGNDWIELKNISSGKVDLSEYSLKDASSELVQLPSIILSSGAYAVIQLSDEIPPSGGDYLPFKLGKEDSVSLVFNGQEVDSLSWKDGEAKQGRSYGRLDGRVGTLYPTPNYDNTLYGVFDLDSVRRVDIDVEDDGWTKTKQDPRAEQYYSATFNLNGAIIDNVGFRTKGQGSLFSVAATGSIRHGFKVNFEEYVDQKFMGMKKLVFNNSFADPSMMRDFLAYKLMGEAGVPSPETSFVDLYIEGEHLGLYLMVEAIDTEFLERHFPDDKKNDLKGDLFKGELYSHLTWIDDKPSSYIQNKEASAGGFGGGFGGFGGPSPTLKQKTNKSVAGTPEEGKSLIPFLQSINAGSVEHIDTDIMVRYLAASALNGNMDSHIGPTANNFYLYDHKSIDKYTLLPWDYNLGMGNWGDNTSSLGGGFGGPIAAKGCMVLDHVIEHPVNDTADARPMIESMLSNASVKADYLTQLQSLVEPGGAFDPEYLEKEILKIATLIDPFVKADPTKFFTYQEWRFSLTQDMPADSDNKGGRGAGIYGPSPGLVPYIKKRSDIVKRQLEGALPSNNSGGGSACPD